MGWRAEMEELIVYEPADLMRMLIADRQRTLSDVAARYERRRRPRARRRVTPTDAGWS